MTDSSDSPQHQPFITHLLELRDRLLRMVLGILALLVIIFPFGNDLYLFLAKPLIDQGVEMTIIDPIGAFLVPFKASLMASVVLAMPWILYQLWSFVAPGLYKHEKQLITPLVVSSTLLFYLGMAFSYFVVFSLIFQFMVATTPDGIGMGTDIGAYLDFILTLFMAFGVAFEVPIATILLVMMGATTPDKLVEKRPYVIVGAFVIGMFLTPPDIISQTLLALPMWVLFELGIIFSRMVKNRRRPNEEGGPDGDGSGSGGSSPTLAPAAGGAAAASDFEPMTEAEMEAELDAMEAEDEDDEDEADIVSDYGDHDEALTTDAIEANIKLANEFRQNGNDERARDLLYDVLQHGNEKQVEVAMNILHQIDDNYH